MNPSWVFTMHRALSGFLAAVFQQIMWFKGIQLITYVCKHHIDWQLTIKKKKSFIFLWQWNVILFPLLSSYQSAFFISMLNFMSISTALSFFPSLSLTRSLCVFLGGWRWEAVESFLGVCFTLLGTTLLPENSLKTGKNATWLNDSTLLPCLSLSLSTAQTQTQPT